MECLPIGLVTGGHPPMKGSTMVLRDFSVRVRRRCPELREPFSGSFRK
jgi:hypothetical protein